MKCTYKELELDNGEVVKLTLNFARLLKLKNDDIGLYEQFMKAMQNKNFDIIEDSLKVVYTAYRCSKIGGDEFLDEYDFIELVPFDLQLINQLASELIMTKKK